MEHTGNNSIVSNALVAQSDCISQGSKVYDSIIRSLQKLEEFISSAIKKIIAGKEEENIVSVNDVKESFESIEDILREIPFYEDEYYTFFSIKLMAFYLLDDESLHHHMYMVIDLINAFMDLIQSKSDGLDEYNAKRKEYISISLKHEQKFYTTICQPSENYDEETLAKIMSGILSL